MKNVALKIQKVSIYDFIVNNQFKFKQIIQILQPKVIDYFSTHLYFIITPFKLKLKKARCIFKIYLFLGLQKSLISWRGKTKGQRVARGVREHLCWGAHFVPPPLKNSNPLKKKY